jgi:glycosyltransferase involved in cell wall biosynthesis
MRVLIPLFNLLWFLAMRSKISVCHTVDSLHPSFGGPSRTVTQLTDALGELSDLDVTLLCQSQSSAPIMETNNLAVTQNVLRSSSPLVLSLGIPIRRAFSLWPLSKRPNILHDHGVWKSTNYWTARTSEYWRVPLVVQPRGMLEPWAINHKAWKKNLALFFYQRRNLSIARVLVATAPAEYENLRALGFRQPIAIIPNGVKLISDVYSCQSSSNLKKVPRTALFLSRIHPKKGILNLLHSWGRLKIEGWRLLIAGPDEGGHLAEVLHLIKVLGIQDKVQYIGEVDDESKVDLFRKSDLFILPTFSENFGIVVAEALSYGLPVITTRGAPWADLEKFGCGWWIDLGIDSLLCALHEAMSLRDEDRQAMGERGRQYVRRYDWHTISRDTRDVYRWILGQGCKPGCVQIN